MRAEELFTSHLLWFMALPAGDAGSVIGDVVASAVASIWNQAIKSTAFLIVPRLSVPAIERECSSNAAGWTKVARILLAARLGIRLRLPQSVLDELSRVARAVDHLGAASES